MMYALLIPISSIIFLFSTYFAIKLYKETDREKYWLFLVVAAFAFTFHSWTYIPYALGLIDFNTFYFIMNIGEIIGGISLAYVAFGLYDSMQKIRKRMQRRESRK